MAGSRTKPSASAASSGAASIAARRTLETATAVAAGLVGAIVAAESLTHDIGWNETGPGSGYFPFRVGLLLIAAAVVRIVQVRLKPDTTQLRLKADAASETFVTRDELRRSLSVFWPTAALVIAMFPLGCYIPSGVYLAWMMRRHGGRGWLVSSMYGAAVMTAFFLIFDVWFRVPLAKGPIEAALGIY